MPRKPATRPADSRGRSMLKMRELVEATGVTGPTILFYINKGLLPQPVRTGPNVAFYPFSFIERINFIKQLQATHRLTLDQIRRILRQRDQGKEVAPLIEMHQEVFGQRHAETMDKAEFAEATGLDVDQIDAAVAADLLIPREAQVFDTQDLAMGQALGKCLALNLALAEAAFYPRAARSIVDREMAIQERLIQGQPYREKLARTMELTRIARTMRAYVIDRIFQRRAMARGGCHDAGSDNNNP